MELPRNIDQAVDRVTSELSFTEKIMIANTLENELIDLQFMLGEYIRKEFRLDENGELMDSCCVVSKVDKINIGHASFTIIIELWKRSQTIFIFKGVVE